MSAGRLAVLLFCVGLLASRVGLVLHELVGHAGVAASLGCRLTELRLFAFGGGYVGYACPALAPAAERAIDLGGIALELALGAGLAGWAWRRPGARGFVAALTGALFLLHGLFYLVTGTHYGVGDGRALHGALGSARAPLVGAGSALLVAGSFVAARGAAGRLAPALRAPGAVSRLATLATAALAAAALHGGLLLLEQRALADPVYAATFQPEAERQVAAELRRFEREQPRRPEEIVARRETLRARHAPFPLRPLLGAAMAGAALAGIASAVRRRTPAPEPGWPRAALGRAALASALAVAAVVAIDRVLRAALGG